MKRSVLAAASMSVILIATLAPGVAAAADAQRFDPVRVRRAHPGLTSALAVLDGNRTVQVAVQLEGPPVAVRQGAALAQGTSLSPARKRELRRTLGTRQRVVAARLRGLGARIQQRYTDVFNGFRVQVKAKNVNKIARLPGVEAVLTVPKHTIDNANTVAYLGADRTWGQTGRTGNGVTIAIIDSGLNYYHRDFAGAGNTAWRDDDPTKREPGTFPTSKVVGGYDLVGDDYDADTQPVPQPDPDSLDCKAKGSENVQHGTHVAGTAAGTGVTIAGRTYTGSYDEDTLNDTDFRVAPGVAPRAKLLAYRVFGCAGSTQLTVDAIERAVRDGADIINMSLGIDFGEAGSLDEIATDNAALAGVVVVASSGNSGASAYLTGAPAAATRAISVAAMDALPGYPGARLEMATGPDIRAINANNATLNVTGKLKIFRDDPGTWVDPSTGKGDESLGCFPQDYTFNDFSDGQVAAVHRGGCLRWDKAVQGQRHDAAAVIVVDVGEGLPPYEHRIAGVTIPFIGVTADDEDQLTANNGKNVTIKSSGFEGNAGFGGVADFSSAGPRGADDAVKPDITAPGVSVFSADGGTTGQGKSLGGTSMASPAIAGVAALVKQAHPGWEPADIKAAIVGTASSGRVAPYDLRLAGSGVAQPRRAVDTVTLAYTDPGASSLTFGLRQAGKRPGSSISFVETRKLSIRNTSSRSIRYDLRNSFNGSSKGLRVSISPSSVTVPAKSRKTIAVTVSLAESAVAGLPTAAPDHAPNLAVDGFGNFYTPVPVAKGVIVVDPRGSGKGVYPLRVPWLVALHGSSDIREVDGSQADWSSNGSRREGSIKFRNFGLHKGWVDVCAWGLTDGRDDLGEIDLRAAGVQSLDTAVCTGESDDSDRCLVFAINTWRRWSNAAASEFFVVIDVNKDGDADYAIDAVDDGLVFLGGFNGVLDALVIDLDSLDVIGGFDAVVAANGTTLLLPALASDLGLDKDGPASFDYWVESYTLVSDSLQHDEMHTGDSAAGTSQNARFDAFKPSLSTGYFKSLGRDKVTTIPLTVNTSNYRPSQGQKGWLVVSMDDANGASQADMIPVGELP